MLCERVSSPWASPICISICHLGKGVAETKIFLVVGRYWGAEVWGCPKKVTWSDWSGTMLRHLHSLLYLPVLDGLGGNVSSLSVLWIRHRDDKSYCWKFDMHGLDRWSQDLSLQPPTFFPFPFCSLPSCKTATARIPRTRGQVSLALKVRCRYSSPCQSAQKPTLITPDLGRCFPIGCSLEFSKHFHRHNFFDPLTALWGSHIFQSPHKCLLKALFRVTEVVPRT